MPSTSRQKQLALLSDVARDGLRPHPELVLDLRRGPGLRLHPHQRRWPLPRLRQVRPAAAAAAAAGLAGGLLLEAREDSGEALPEVLLVEDEAQVPEALDLDGLEVAGAPPLLVLRPEHAALGARQDRLLAGAHRAWAWTPPRTRRRGLGLARRGGGWDGHGRRPPQRRPAAAIIGSLGHPGAQDALVDGAPV